MRRSRLMRKMCIPVIAVLQSIATECESKKERVVGVSNRLITYINRFGNRVKSGMEGN